MPGFSSVPLASTKTVRLFRPVEGAGELHAIEGGEQSRGSGADIDQPPAVAEPGDDRPGGRSDRFAGLIDGGDGALLPLGEGRENRSVVPRIKAAIVLADGFGCGHRGERNDPSRCDTY